MRYENNINEKTDGEEKSRDQSEDHLTANGQSLQTKTTKTVDKPFKCSICNMTYNFMSNVKRHLRNMHKITDNLNDFIINEQKTNSDDPSVGQSETKNRLSVTSVTKCLTARVMSTHLREYHKLTKVVLN